MEAVMSSPEKRQFVWNRRLAQLDYNSQIDSARSEGRAEGRAEGEADGVFKTLSQLVKDQLLSIAEAAKRCNMTEVEFCQKAGIQFL